MKKKLTIALCIFLIVGWAATGIAFYQDHQKKTALILGLNQSNQYLHEKNDDMELHIKKLTDENRELDRKNIGLEQKAAALNQQILEKDAVIRNQEKTLAEKENALQALTAEKKALQTAAAKKDEEIASLQSSLAAREERLDALLLALEKLSASLIQPGNAPSPQITPATPAPFRMATPTPDPFSTLCRGQAGDKVKTLQEMLKALKYYAGEINGVFNAETENAVKAFQRDNHMIVDGIASPELQHMLFAQMHKH